MSRKERRAALSRGQHRNNPAGDARATDNAAATESARELYRRGDFSRARTICEDILARAPDHVPSLNLTALMAQAAGRHNAAIKMLAKALAADEFDPACHYNIASSYLALDRRDEAIEHFRKAILLGMGETNVEAFILQSEVLGGCLQRIRQKWPLPLKADELAGPAGMGALADDVFLRCAIECAAINDVATETLLTYLRAALLELTVARAPAFAGFEPNVLALFCAIGQQCFINEYVYAQGEGEAAQAERLRDVLNRKLADGDDIPPLLLVAVANYVPLHTLPQSRAILDRDWPSALDGLLRLQIRGPLEEAEDRKAIPVLTAIDDAVSRAVMRQYEENPYPRWMLNPLALAVARGRRQKHGPADADRTVKDVLIAGCGTGRHAVQTSQYFPDAHILAIDVSLASLAYARRMTREAGLSNIEYAQADILKLGSIGRTFDMIEAAGALHHLADPKAGWEVLLSLLRPDGRMVVGLYSELWRRPVVQARALIAERGYRPTPQDIRACRHEIMRDSADWRWKRLMRASDFYSMSGCRDLLFNVMEHRFTIPQIKAFLTEHGLAFHGFDLDAEALARYRLQHPEPDALTDLDRWHLFEVANPTIFSGMYQFTVSRR